MTDRFTVRAVVVTLGLIALLGMLLIAGLAYDEKAVPTELVAITSGAAGALGALLARTSIDSSNGGDDFGGGV